MHVHDLVAHTKRVRLKVDGTNYAKTAGTSDTLTSEALDTQGYTGVLFRVGFGALTSTAATAIKVQQSSDAAGSPDDFSDLLGSAQTVADSNSNKVFEVQILKPGKRYLKFLTTRATANAVVDFLEAILYNPVRMPVGTDATIGGQEAWVSPAEGTA